MTWKQGNTRLYWLWDEETYRGVDRPEWTSVYRAALVRLVAAVAVAGLGLPALILSLYGTDSFLPLSSFDHAWRALLPIAVTVRRGAVVAVLVGMLWFAGAPAVKG